MKMPIIFTKNNKQISPSYVVNVLLLLTSFFLLPFFLSAQISLQDSLLTALKTPASDTTRVNDLHVLAGTYWGSDLQLATEYAQQSLELAKKLDYKMGIMKAEYKLGATAYFKGDFQMAEKYILSSKKRAETLNAPAYIDANIGILGVIYQDQSKYVAASKLFLEAIESQEAAGDIIGKAISYINLGNVYGKQDQNELAKKYTLMATKIFEETNDENGKTYLGQAYVNMGIYEESDSLSLIYNEKAIEQAKLYNNKNVLAHASANIGGIYLEQKRVEQALPYFQNALEWGKEIGIASLIISTQSSLATIYSVLGNPSNAIQLLEESKRYAREIGLQKEAMEAAISLSEVYAKEKYFDNAYAALLEGKELYDTIYSQQQLKITAELDAKYERKQQEAALAKQELKIAQQKNTQNRIIIGGLVFLLGIISLFQSLMFRQKRKKQATELALKTQKLEAKRLKELDQLKSNFFANISHEFRTPLTLIIAPLRAFLKGDSGTNPQKIYKLMLRNAERLLTLINQLLDLSKLEAGKMQLQTSEQDLIQWIRPIFFAFESLAERKQINYELLIPNQEIVLRFDVDKMEKIISNLLSNAFKFTLKEGKIQLKIEQQEKQVQIKVSDDGIGIPKDKLEAIFTRFFQADDSSTKAYQGTGIGLALVKELVNLHKGNITVESDLNNGTTFIIQLAINSTKLLPATTLISPNLISSSTFSKQKNYPVDAKTDTKITTAAKDAPLILVVEDNEDIRTYIQNILETDYKVEVAGNGLIGLGKAQSSIPDLIITDLMMPEMDGIELSKQLKTNASTSHIPVIMLTARAAQADKLEGLQTGADDYLTKPFDKEELLLKIHNLIQQRQLLREKYSRSISLKNTPEEMEYQSQEDRFIQKVVNIIEANLEAEEFGVEELSKAVFLSRFQLHRKMKALTNKSISVFIRTIRLQHAKGLLENGKGNVSEIAFQLGFNSVAYFSKCFSDEFGYPPSQVIR